MSEPADTAAGQPGVLRSLGEVGAVVVLLLLGSLAGAATGWLPLASILGMVLPLAAATYFLRRQGSSWRDLGFLRGMAWRRVAVTAVATAAVAILGTGFLLTPVMRAFGTPPPDPQLIVDAVQGDLWHYLMFLLPVVWGSAAFGEELLFRGFVMQRFAGLAGPGWGIVLQAALFGLGHSYQGTAGVVNLFFVGLLLGYVYQRSGRNLWPVIVAHGLIDTLSITLVYLGYADPAGIVF